MAPLSVIGTITVVMVVITGFVTLLLLLMPAFLYHKEFDKMEKEGKSAIEVISKVFIMHLSVTLLVLFFYSAFNVMFDTKNTRDFAPKYSLGLFLGFYNAQGEYSPEQHGVPAWETWDELAKKGEEAARTVGKSNSIGSNTSRVVGACMIIVPVLHVLLWLFLGFIPVFCILYPIFYAARRNMKDPETFRTLTKKYGMVLPHMVIITVLAYLHLTVVSAFVGVQLDNSNFHFWDMLNNVWGNSKYFRI